MKIRGCSAFHGGKTHVNRDGLNKANGFKSLAQNKTERECTTSTETVPYAPTPPLPEAKTLPSLGEKKENNGYDADSELTEIFDNANLNLTHTSNRCPSAFRDETMGYKYTLRIVTVKAPEPTKSPQIFKPIQSNKEDTIGKRQRFNGENDTNCKKQKVKNQKTNNSHPVQAMDID